MSFQAIEKEYARLYWTAPDEFEEFRIKGINWSALGTVTLDQAEKFAKSLLELVKEGRELEKFHSAETIPPK